MTTKEIVIRLICERRPDGWYAITSPDVSMFYIADHDAPTAMETALPILKEHLERNSGWKVLDLRIGERPEEVLGKHFASNVSGPIHVITKLAA